MGEIILSLYIGVAKCGANSFWPSLSLLPKNLSPIKIVDPVLGKLYVALESVLRSEHMGDIAS